MSLLNSASAGFSLNVGGNNFNTTYFGALSDTAHVGSSGSLVKVGSGILTLAGSSSYTGSTTINGGSLRLGDGTAGHDGSINGTSGVTDNATLVLNWAGPLNLLPGYRRHRQLDSGWQQLRDARRPQHL